LHGAYRPNDTTTRIQGGLCFAPPVAARKSLKAGRGVAHESIKQGAEGNFSQSSRETNAAQISSLRRAKHMLRLAGAM
jgi:hypothetical protein